MFQESYDRFALINLDTQLAEIVENLIRNELRHLERTEQLKRRKEIYEAKHPETKQRVARSHGKAKDASAESAPGSFVKDTAKKTGRSPRVVEEDRLPPTSPKKSEN